MLSEGKHYCDTNVSTLYFRKKSIGVQDMHETEIDYVSENDAELNIHK